MARSPTSRSFAVFTLNPLPSQLDARLVQKLVRAEPATIGHFRNWGFMDPAIRAMQSDLRIAGPAVTVRVTRYAQIGLHGAEDRKSTRLNSSHGYISYAVFCLKKKKTNRKTEHSA